MFGPLELYIFMLKNELKYWILHCSGNGDPCLHAVKDSRKKNLKMPVMRQGILAVKLPRRQLWLELTSHRQSLLLWAVMFWVIITVDCEHSTAPISLETWQFRSGFIRLYFWKGRIRAVIQRKYGSFHSTNIRQDVRFCNILLN